MVFAELFRPLFPCIRQTENKFFVVLFAFESGFTSHLVCQHQYPGSCVHRDVVGELTVRDVHPFEWTDERETAFILVKTERKIINLEFYFHFHETT